MLLSTTPTAHSTLLIQSWPLKQIKHFHTSEASGFLLFSHHEMPSSPCFTFPKLLRKSGIPLHFRPHSVSCVKKIQSLTPTPTPTHQLPTYSYLGIRESTALLSILSGATSLFLEMNRPQIQLETGFARQGRAEARTQSTTGWVRMAWERAQQQTFQIAKETSVVCWAPPCLVWRVPAFSLRKRCRARELCWQASINY